MGRRSNGLGSVVKLSGNRTRPWRAKAPMTGRDERGFPIVKIIGDYKTGAEALAALAEYIKNPYDVDQSKITFSELWELFREKKSTSVSTATMNAIKGAYKHCKNLYDVPYRNIKSWDMQNAINACPYGYTSRSFIRNLFHHIERFANELDITNTQYHTLLKIGVDKPDTDKTPFTDKEIEQLWQIQDQPWTDTVLMYLYSGWRPAELLELKTENVDLENGTMKGGKKTAASKNRIVPIHSKIFPLVKKRYEEGHEYLISKNGQPLPTRTYARHFDSVMAAINAKHTPHEARHTLRTRLDRAGGNQVCIDRILGHTSAGIGQKTYTHKTLEELREALHLVS